MSARTTSRPRMKRRYPRLTLRVEVALETPSGPLRAVATTLGAGGLFVATDSPLPAHTPLGVCFALPGEAGPLRLEAHVAWSAPPGAGGASPGMGLEFDDPDARAALAARLEEWAARREAGAAECDSRGESTA